MPESLTGNTVQYRLYGVLVHLGYTSHSGHYYAYVRAPNGHQWFKADDSCVSATSVQDALNQNAYILFYTRTDSPATTATATNGVATAAAKPSPQTTINNSTSSSSMPVHLQPRSILLNGSLKNQNNHIPNNINNNPSNNNSHTVNTLKNDSSLSSSTSSYLNGIFVGKRPSNSPSFIPRVRFKHPKNLLLSFFTNEF